MQGKTQLCNSNATRLGFPAKNWNRNTKAERKCKEVKLKYKQLSAESSIELRT